MVSVIIVIVIALCFFLTVLHNIGIRSISYSRNASNPTQHPLTPGPIRRPNVIYHAFTLKSPGRVLMNIVVSATP